MTFLKLRKLKKFDFVLEEHIKDRGIFTYYSESKQVETLISNMHIQHIINAVKKIDDGRRSAIADHTTTVMRNEIKYREMLYREDQIRNGDVEELKPKYAAIAES